MLLVLITLFIHNVLGLKQRYNTYREPITRATVYVPEELDDWHNDYHARSPGLINGRAKLERMNFNFCSGLIDKTCLLNPDRGPCRSEISMYYFDPKTKDCSKFFWGGCQGNGNRFDTRYDCIQNCLKAPNGRRQRPKWCSLTFDYGFCFGSLTRWYYDPIWKVCKERIYSGCGGNKNNFYNKEQCESICNYQTGVLKYGTKKKDKVKKILIINPIGATSKRGKSQRSTVNMILNKTQ